VGEGGQKIYYYENFQSFFIRRVSKGVLGQFWKMNMLTWWEMECLSKHQGKELGNKYLTI
jgi:hypothetical protein